MPALMTPAVGSSAGSSRMDTNRKTPPGRPDPPLTTETSKVKASNHLKYADIIKSYEYLHGTGNFMSDQMQAVRDEILEILRKNEVKRAAFFGSIVRGEMDEESDIDILIEFEGRKSL
ncbi:MAG: hypothetical protein METHAR1v1_990001, partial [Methanothrix sp.]